MITKTVMPAKAGIPAPARTALAAETPAFAGVTLLMKGVAA